MYPRLQGRR
ncbi:hypothetical protein ACHAXM_006390 [Skeletonema potamos]